MGTKYNNKHITFDGYDFKSLLEKRTYQLLKEAGLNPKYESETFRLLEKFALEDKVLLYKPRGVEKTLSLNKRTILGTTYTPDFIFEYRGHKVFYDTKGKVNDTYPIKLKFFLLLQLQISEKPVIFFEPHSLRQVKQSIEILKNLPYHK